MSSYRNIEQNVQEVSCDTPLVSIVIPAFNAAEFIEETLASVFAQTYPSIEVIVVDDGSTDATAEILRDQQDRITVLTQANSGQASARNHGARVSRGSMLCFIDADDLFDPGKIKQQVAVLARFNEAVAAYCDCRVIDAAGNVVQESNALSVVRHSGDVAASFLKAHSVTTPGMVLIRRSAFSKAGGFNERKIHRGHEDGVFWLRLALEGPIVYSPETLMSYRRHAAQETQRSDFRLTLSKSRVQRLIDVKDTIDARDDADLKLLLEHETFNAGIYAAWLSRRHRDRASAITYARLATSIQPFSFSAWRALLLGVMLVPFFGKPK